MKAKRLLSLLLTIVLCVSAAMAQSSGDKLYNEGLRLQKTMTVQAQNQAISKFKSAKKIYDSAAKKSQCDQAISVSQNIIRQLQGGGGGGGRGNNNNGGNTRPEKEKATLEVNNTMFDLTNEGKRVSVTVNTNQSWNIYPAETSTGESFISVNKTSDNTAEITVQPNNSYDSREQSCFILAGDLQKEIIIKQTGKPVSLTVGETAITFKSKGGNKTVDILCNSDQQFAENSNMNWYVISKPDWVSLSLNNNQKKGGLGGVLGTLKEKADQAADKLTGRDSNSQNQSIPSDMVVTPVKIICDPVIKGSGEERTGRKGKIILGSGNLTATIEITQNPK